MDKCIRYGVGIRLGLRSYGGKSGANEIVDIYNSGALFSHSVVRERNLDKQQKKSIMFGNGDMFELVIDVIAAEIKCNRNGEEMVSLFDNQGSNKMDFKCKFFVGLYDTGNSVTLIDFQAI